VELLKSSSKKNPASLSAVKPSKLLGCLTVSLRTDEKAMSITSSNIFITQLRFPDQDNNGTFRFILLHELSNYPEGFGWIAAS
jgi:hypothetical protein